mmetsp:Transcript_15565/g.23183  ORF Transcript_15565/g.23183 Transcript_15565/m.23183 type:complete len:267 (+) Transcript_15565:29-829(+)|eukprot:CAMPEP_0171470686 /NCGR_PEP_ID=MMETSP0946-20130122/284_1 /TAXON_ID=109269 /ORGANISM="Vaucheria litorea, Strain CCMP2940" /LENGTH=266 /DNA_ID=CAMNT_0012000087 /DNA_START=32 /DNA_END=832 /DNA_ORIENTATION=-
MTQQDAGCPIRPSATDNGDKGSGSWASSLYSLFSRNQKLSENETTLPIDKFNPKVGDFEFGQEKRTDQTKSLSTHRQMSSILKAEETPQHQPEGKDVWVYPSEQQYFNAMKRKGWDAKEKDVPVVLAIHNAVNEQGWAKVKEWEALKGGTPRLKEFKGRPQDTSPRAWLKTNLLGYKPPFDRHDWLIESKGGKVTRYVLDFYAGKGTLERPVALYLDVRPALDSFQDAFHRLSMFTNKNFGFNPMKLIDSEEIEGEKVGPSSKQSR